MQDGQVRFASGCSLTVSKPVLKDIYEDLEFFRSKLLLRPQEITNSPEIVRRLGIISINTAIEVDITGNVNSTHVLGRNMMSGIGGSGDFARNAFFSIFTCPSTAKGGKISTIVPLVSHLDSSEHSVQVIITEQGVADLRGNAPANGRRPSSRIAPIRSIADPARYVALAAFIIRRRPSAPLSPCTSPSPLRATCIILR